MQTHSQEFELGVGGGGGRRGTPSYGEAHIGFVHGSPQGLHKIIHWPSC